MQLITLHNEAAEEKAKQQLTNIYQIAYLTSVFTNRTNNGKQPPSLQEVFPEIFKVEASEEEEINQQNYWLYYKEQMLDYTLAHNRLAKEVSEYDT